MSIEAQTLDLYTRASESNQDRWATDALKNIAEEERTHLEQLGHLMDA
jgi:rubrerythrin